MAVAIVVSWFCKACEGGRLVSSWPFPRAAVGPPAFPARALGEGVRRTGSAILRVPVAPPDAGKRSSKFLPHLGPHLLHFRAKPKPWLGKREVGRRPWRRGEAAQGGQQWAYGFCLATPC